MALIALVFCLSRDVWTLVGAGAVTNRRAKHVSAKGVCCERAVEIVLGPVTRLHRSHVGCDYIEKETSPRQVRAAP